MSAPQRLRRHPRRRKRYARKGLHAAALPPLRFPNNAFYHSLELHDTDFCSSLETWVLGLKSLVPSWNKKRRAIDSATQASIQRAGSLSRPRTSTCEPFLKKTIHQRAIPLRALPQKAHVSRNSSRGGRGKKFVRCSVFRGIYVVCVTVYDYIT